MKFINIQADDMRIKHSHGYMGKIKLSHVWMRKDFFMKILNESPLNLEPITTDYKCRTHKFQGVPVDVIHECKPYMPFNVVLVRE